MFKIKIKRRKTNDIRELLPLSLQYHQSGNLRKAEYLYRKILKVQPDHFDVLHMLGVLYAQLKNQELAEKFIRKAIKIIPTNAYAHYNLGNVFRDKGQFLEASLCYQNVMELHRNNEKSCGGLGIQFPDNMPFDAALSIHRETYGKSILISVPVFNRKRITRLSLMQTKRYKTSECHLQVYNDHSTDFDNSFLTPYADEVIQLPDKLGIGALRRHQFREFLKTDFDFIYMTDSDVIHDLRFIAALEVLYEAGDRKLPVCIFNSTFHVEPSIILYRKNGIMLKKTAPGVSMFYDRTMVNKIVAMFKPGYDDLNWDYAVIQYLGLPWVTSETSYLEHYGGGGIHNTDYERDRAIIPTEYLSEKRETILKYLMNNQKPGSTFEI
ncbi:MAG: tetratricopeptide repeat protein [Thermodesulfovibrionales bacterium]|nr:tetratricopeptide repeat protein [Thermodesulfovibrionales bacterium]